MSAVVTAVVIAAASAALAGYTSYAQTQAMNASAKFQASVAERNAQNADMQAKDATERGRIAEKQQRLKVAQAIGQQRAAYGASGVLVDSGSSMDIVQDTVRQGEMDALTVRRNAAMEAWGYKNQAANSRAEGDLSLMNVRSAGAAATTSFLSSALNSAGSYAMVKAAKN